MLALITLASLIALAAAGPLPAPVAAPEPQASFTPTGRSYLLKSVSSNAAFTNLYVEAYHTGAGFNDAVLVPKKPSASSNPATGFLNGTYQEFDLGSEFPWGMVMSPSITYNAWLPVQINAGFGSPGFYFNNTDGTGVKGLKWVDGWPYELAGSKYNDFHGWLACNWAHGLPQLFWLAAAEPSSSDPIPCNCAKVELVREFTE